MSGARAVNAGFLSLGRRLAGTAAVLGLVFAGPGALGAWVARPFDSTHTAQPPLLVAQAAGASASRVPAQSTSGAPVAVGSLFTNGVVEVTSLGGPVKVNTAVYPYLGGEQIVVPPGAMAVLRLGDSGLVFFCGGSVSAFAVETGRPVLTLEKGSVRVISALAEAVAIRAGEQTLTGAPQTGTLFAAEVVRDRDGLKVLPLEGLTAASGEELIDDRTGHAIWSVQDGPPTSLGFPASVPKPARLAGPMPGLLGGGDYLCRADELALVLAQNRSPPVAEPIDLPPFLAPPGAPRLALASPDAGEQFDPNALPPPAAGPGTPQVIVPAPSLPVSGAGGGALATPE